MNVMAAGRTETGPRTLNQDWLDWRLDLGFFVVADGMGGHNAGEVAAHLAVESVRGFVVDSAAIIDITWPFGLEPARSMDANRLATGIRLANRRIYSEGLAHAALSGMGTTVVAALLNDGHMALASVGDSRIYRCRDGALEQLTTDDTWMNAVLGQSDADCLDSTHPLRHVLTSVVGTREDVRPALRDEVLLAGDRLLLCTDGVHGRLDKATLCAVLAADHTPDEMASTLLAEALKQGTTDNVTALVIRVG